MTESQKWYWLVALAAGGYLLYLLSPVLTPFVAGAVLAYIGDPVADRLERHGLSRSLSVVTVFVVLVAVVFVLMLVVIPLLERQVVLLASKLPAYIDWVQRELLPAIGSFLGVDLGGLELGALKTAASDYWQQAASSVGGLVSALSRSGATLLGWLANLVLIPVVTFYLLRDWDVMVGRIRELLPRRIEPDAVRLARSSDEVLGAFFRGQLIVMLALGVIYSLGLSLVGLDLALLIGMLAGLVSFVPYLGFIVGIVAAGIAAVMQFQDAVHLLYIVAVFGVGQAVEGMVLQPLLLGERIGLHPVAVIFAVMAGGQLFGFIGVLLALPVAAVIMVLLRYAHERYLRSDLYGDVEATEKP